MPENPWKGYAPGQDVTLGPYLFLMGLFNSAVLAFAAWFRRSGRTLPERMDERDMLLLALAAHKGARLIAKDRVTSPFRAPFTELQGPGGVGETEEKARGRGLRRAVGDLLICPYCLGMWVTTALVLGMLVAPRATRWVSAVLAIFFGSELLQIAYKRAEELI